jgi:hypothetical protein
MRLSSRLSLVQMALELTQHTRNTPPNPTQHQSLTMSRLIYNQAFTRHAAA